MKKTKFKIYERTWDLTKEDRTELAREGLQKGLYTYFGKASSKTYISNRDSSWRNKYKKKELPTKIQLFMESLEQFYKNKELIDTDIDKLMFGTSNIVAYCQDDRQLRRVEKYYITKRDLVCGMVEGLIVEDPVILLNTKDSSVYKVKDGGITIRGVKPLEMA